MPRTLGQLETAALAFAQMRNLRTLRVGELASGLRLSAKQERELLSRMARSGLIANVRKGLYLFPPRLPLGGIWTPDEATAINALMADKNARYQIAGPKAFNRYGYSDQLPSLTTIYNDAISGERRVGSVTLQLIKVARDRLGGVEKVRMPSGETLVYSSRARTLVDAVYDWSRFDSLPEAYDWIRADLVAGRIAADELARAAVRYGNMGSIRRIGAILERLGASKAARSRLARAVTATTAKIPLVPTRPARGPVSRPWGVVINDRP
jgi:predicted transcriptional regulator of viral defense system